MKALRHALAGLVRLFAWPFVGFGFAGSAMARGLQRLADTIDGVA